MATTAERVRELIRSSALTQHDFAQRIGLDDSKLSKSLAGGRRFSSLDLARVAETCGVTVDWLITGEEPPLALAARTTGGSAGTAVRHARQLATLRSDMAAFGYPQPWHPLPVTLGRGTWASQGDRLAVSALTQVQRAGADVTTSDLPGLLEDVFGVDVAVVELGPGFDGLATSTAEVKLILLATSQVPARQRFTLAHELGHLLAGDDQGVHLDEDVDRHGREPTEQRANAFAASFLMPEPILRKAVSAGFDQPRFAALACDLMVTPSALAYRLKVARLIDAGGCDRLRTLTAARAAAIAGRGSEYAQRVVDASRVRPPGLLARDTYIAYEAGAATLRPYANLLGVPVEQLRQSLEFAGGASDAS